MHATVTNADLTQIINTNRGHNPCQSCLRCVLCERLFSFLWGALAGCTLSSTIRRKPNAFNLVHQLELMVRGGHSQEHSVQALEA